MKDSFSKQDIRTVMKFFDLDGKTTTELNTSLRNVFGESTPAEGTVRKWYRYFKDGRTSVEDEERSGRPVSASTDENIELVCWMLAEDRGQTCEELADASGLSIGTVHKILTQHLDKK